MAKSLEHTPPSSTVARLLDSNAAARAISVSPDTQPLRGGDSSHDPLVADRGTPTVREAQGIKRELTLSPATDETFTQLIDLYRHATGARVSASHVARAMLSGIARCLPSLQREASRIGRLRLPPNAPGHDQQREQLEQRIGNAFVEGIRGTWSMGRS